MNCLAEVDLFHLFRGSLALVCGIYAVISTARALSRWLGPHDPHRPHDGWIKRYLVTQLLRVRIRIFALDLLQIAFLFVLFCYLIILHR